MINWFIVFWWSWFIHSSCCKVLSVWLFSFVWSIALHKITAARRLNWRLSFFCCFNSCFSSSNSIQEFIRCLVCSCHVPHCLHWSIVNCVWLLSVFHCLKSTRTNLEAALIFKSSEVNLPVCVVHFCNIRSMVVVCIVEAIVELSLHISVKVTMETCCFAQFKLLLSTRWLMRFLSKS